MFRMTVITPDVVEYIDDPREFWVRDCCTRNASQLCVRCVGYSRYILYEHYFRSPLFEAKDKLVSALREALKAGKESIVVQIF